MIGHIERNMMEHYTERKPKSALIGNIVFLLLSLPLSLVYFTLAITGFSLGVGTLVIWIGLPILFATLYMVHGMAEIERNMVRSLLHMPHPDLAHERMPAQGLLRRLGNLLRDPYTWTGLLYMLFIKLPLGIISFTLTLTFLLVSICLAFLPLAYLISLFVNVILLKSGVQPGDSILIPYFLEVHGSFDPLMFARSFVGLPLGFVFGFLTIQLIRGLASFSGILANVMLGPGTTEHVMQPHTPGYNTPSNRWGPLEPRRTWDYATSDGMLEQQVYTE